MRNPGLDRHEWESEWQALEPLVVDSPEESLPELDELVARMLAASGYPVEEGESDPATPAGTEGVEPEVLAGYRVARELTRRTERGEEVGPGEVGQAVGIYRELYQHLLARAADRG